MNTDFYSRPCGRGDGPCSGRQSPGVFISTHAPAGGATRAAIEAAAADNIISTHAPAGGATNTADADGDDYTQFLLTPLREGRQQFSTSPS